jgi:hypothetical protein
MIIIKPIHYDGNYGKVPFWPFIYGINILVSLLNILCSAISIPFRQDSSQDKIDLRDSLLELFLPFVMVGMAFMMDGFNGTPLDVFNKLFRAYKLGKILDENDTVKLKEFYQNELSRMEGFEYQENSMRYNSETIDCIKSIYRYLNSKQLEKFMEQLNTIPEENRLRREFNQSMINYFQSLIMDESGLKDLLGAIDHQDVEAVKKLIKSRGSAIDYNCRPHYGLSILGRALFKGGHPEIVQALVDAGADVNSQDSLGHTELELAIHCKKPASVKILLDRGANVSPVLNGPSLNRPSVYEDLIESIARHPNNQDLVAIKELFDPYIEQVKLTPLLARDKRLGAESSIGRAFNEGPLGEIQVWRHILQFALPSSTVSLAQVNEGLNPEEIELLNVVGIL